MPYFYLSFCDPDRPVGEQFLGATVVEAADDRAALVESFRRGLNPGNCEVMMGQLDGLPDPDPLNLLNRFATREEVYSVPHTMMEF